MYKVVLRAVLDIFNTLRLRQNGRHFADDIFKCIFLNENAWISLEISLRFVPKVQINNIPALVQIMARRRPGNKPLSEPMMVSLLTHICVTRPQWVKLFVWLYLWWKSHGIHKDPCRFCFPMLFRCGTGTSWHANINTYYIALFLPDPAIIQVQPDLWWHKNCYIDGR